MTHALPRNFRKPHTDTRPEVGRDGAGTVKVLFAPLQVAAGTALALVVANEGSGPAVLHWSAQFYTGLLLALYLATTWRLFLGSWRWQKLCSQDTSVATVAATYHLGFGVWCDVPAAAVIAGLMLLTLGLYALQCRRAS